MITEISVDEGRKEDTRKVTSGLSVLRLLFCEEARERDNICVDFFLCYRNSRAIHLSHVVCLQGIDSGNDGFGSGVDALGFGG